MDRAKQQQMISGVAIISLGLALYFLQRTQSLGNAAVFFIVGAFFLAAYLYRRAHGLLIPACILLGLGSGKMFEASDWSVGDATKLGLGFGFVAIFVIALLYERRSHWWPLIPGGILILLGFPDTEGVVAWMFENWPLILVFIGVLVFIGAFGQRRRPSRGAAE